MKKLLIVFFLILLFFLIMFWRVTPFCKGCHSFRKNQTETPSSIESRPTPIAVSTIEYNNTKYAYAFFEVNSGQDLSFIPNFEEKLTIQEIAAKYHCQNAINGGFYTTDRKPLGAFIANGKEIGKQKTNSLINAYLSIQKSKARIDPDQIGIDYSYPSDTPDILLQNGPMVYFDSRPVRLAINNDEPNRRMVAATTASGSLLFLTIYNPDSVYSGPLLGDVPAILEEIDIQSDESLSFIKNAMNLDGGTASAFIGNGTSLSELQPVGSVFCLKY